MGFNSQPPEGGWLQLVSLRNPHISVSTHSRPKAAGTNTDTNTDTNTVSTHSRPKAAGAAAETLGPQGLHRPVLLRFHQRHMTLLYHSQVRPIFSKLLKKSSLADLRAF